MALLELERSCGTVTEHVRSGSGAASHALDKSKFEWLHLTRTAA